MADDMHSKAMDNLVPRLYLAAMEKSPGCRLREIKSGWRPGYEVRLWRCNGCQ